MSYRILRTDKANDQLYAIIQYIAEDSGSVDIALGMLDELEEAVKRLAENPRLGSYPRYSMLRKQGYRALIVRRYLVFYKVDDENKQVIIYAVFDAKQNYVNLL